MLVGRALCTAKPSKEGEWVPVTPRNGRSGPAGEQSETTPPVRTGGHVRDWQLKGLELWLYGLENKKNLFMCPAPVCARSVGYLGTSVQHSLSMGKVSGPPASSRPPAAERASRRGDSPGSPNGRSNGERTTGGGMFAG